MKKVFRVQVTHSKGRRCFYITAQTSRPRWGFDVCKAMNLDTIETVPSGEDCGLGGIDASPCLLCITCEYGIGGYRGPPAGVNWGLLDSGSEAGMTEEKSAGMTHL